MVDSGIAPGAYMFYRANSQEAWDDQFRTFRLLVNRQAESQPTMMVPALHFEPNEKNDGPIDVAKYTDRAGKMVRAALAEWGSVIVMTNAELYGKLGAPTFFHLPHVMLWWQAWDHQEPDVPSGRAWTFWQHRIAQPGEVAGVKGKIDLNWFNGDTDRLPLLLGDRQDDGLDDDELDEDEAEAVELVASLDEMNANLVALRAEIQTLTEVIRQFPAALSAATTGDDDGTPAEETTD